MNDELLKKLEQRLDRRSFLRGSSLAAAALIGAAAFPLSVAAQGQPAQSKPADKPEDKKEEKKDDKPADPKDEKKPEPSTGKTEEDPFKVTKLDEKGKPYRLCPQCGYNMYQQDKTWSCENCGYSYTE